MKITIYELLGMVKDGKAPKKIKYREMIYHICYEYGDYESDIEEYRFGDTKEHYYLFEGIDMLKCLNDEVEVCSTGLTVKEATELSLKEATEKFYKISEGLANKKREKKIPEKLNLDTDELRGKETPRAIDYLIESKINEVIDYLKSKEKGE